MQGIHHKVPISGVSLHTMSTTCAKQCGKLSESMIKGKQSIDINQCMHIQERGKRDRPNVASGETLVHEHQGVLTSGTRLLGEALDKKALVLVMSNPQRSLLAASCQI